MPREGSREVPEPIGSVFDVFGIECRAFAFFPDRFGGSTGCKLGNRVSKRFSADNRNGLKETFDRLSELSFPKDFSRFKVFGDSR